MITRKTLFLAAALAMAAAPSVFAGPVTYKEAASLWSADQAVRFPPAITRDFLKGVEKDLGRKAAAELSAKKDKVEGLLKRFKTCDLNAEDVKTAGKYLNSEFRTEVVYFAEQGCSKVKEAAAGRAAAPVSKACPSTPIWPR